MERIRLSKGRARRAREKKIRNEEKVKRVSQVVVMAARKNESSRGKKERIKENH